MGGYRPLVVSKRPEGRQWSKKTKAKAVRDWLKTGSYAETARKNKVPIETIENWKRTNWWGELVEQYREELDIRLSSKIDEVQEKAIEQVLDRLVNGEQILDSKTGTVINVPVKARDAATITKILADRQDVLIKRKKQENQSNETVKDKLDQLASHFASFVKQTNVKPPEIIDGELVQDAFYEERKA